jgi:soluble cytochrome b562
MEETKMSEAISEINKASEEELKSVVERWFESTRMDGLKLGAYMISSTVYDAIVKNIKTGSLRDYQRAIKAICDIVYVQLKHETVQNDLEEVADDGTAE